MGQLPHELDRLVHDHMARYRVPGLSLAVARHGELLHAAGYGVATLEHQVPATSATIYQTASVGKQFTAALVLLMADRGLLGIDQLIAPHFQSAPRAWAKVTVRHLLTHTSGISDVPFDNLNLRLDYNDGELLNMIGSAPLEFEPGSAWDYSNSGYILLGLLIAQITGRYYGDLLREWIFGPLGMTTARTISEEEIISNRASGYRLDGDRVLNQEYVSPSLNRTADGGLYISVLDLAKWDRVLHTGNILSEANCEAMWTPVQLSSGATYGYGFGWYVGSSALGRLVEHEGEWQGFSAHIVRYLDDGLSVMVLSNSCDAPVAELSQAIASGAAVVS